VSDATQQHVAQGRRKLGPAVVTRGGEQLLGEKRVATRAGMDGLEEARVEVTPRDGLELLGRFPASEGRKLDPVDAARPLELGEEGQQRMASMKLVRAIGQHEHDRNVAQVAHEEAEQVAGGLVGPVKVLDDERDRAFRGQPLEHAEQKLEQPALR
jgi:hypothetical protein